MNSPPFTKNRRQTELGEWDVCESYRIEGGMKRKIQQNRQRRNTGEGGALGRGRDQHEQVSGERYRPETQVVQNTRTKTGAPAGASVLSLAARRKLGRTSIASPSYSHEKRRHLSPRVCYRRACTRPTANSAADFFTKGWDQVLEGTPKIIFDVCHATPPRTASVWLLAQVTIPSARPRCCTPASRGPPCPTCNTPPPS